MDYMHLGVRSRKTGINAKQGLEKDEYSMERIDDFFSEDSTSQVNGDRRKSRRSSMLSLLSGGGPSGSFASDFEHQQRSTSPSRRTSRLHRFSLPENDTIQEEERIDDNNVPIAYESPPPSFRPPQSSPSDRMEEPLDGPSIRLTPEKSTNRDVPDLIQDDEDTRDYTSFNTSENALLEDEMDDDYEAVIEEDRDYVEGESSLEKSSSDDDSSSISGSDSDGEDTSMAKSDEDEGALATVPSRRTYGYDGLPSEVYDSDDEYIQKQASELDQQPLVADGPGLRRSNRVKVAPLEWWRNEKVVYKRKTSKPILEIDKIVTYDRNDDEDEEEELGIGRKKRNKKKPTTTTTRTRPYNYIPTGKPRGRPRKHKAFNMTSDGADNPNIDLLDEINQGKIPQGEWLQHGILEANVNVTADRQKDEIIAFAPNLSQSEQIKETEDEHFSLEVMFDSHKEHFASGMLKLPLRGKKNLSESYNVFITFFVVQGVLEVTLAGNTFITTEGSSFQIPAFNEYAFENRGNNEVKMFFTQVTVSTDELQNNSSNENSDEEMQSQSFDSSVNNKQNNYSGDTHATRWDNEPAAAKRSSLSSMSISDI